MRIPNLEFCLQKMEEIAGKVWAWSELARQTVNAKTTMAAKTCSGSDFEKRVVIF